MVSDYSNEDVFRILILDGFGKGDLEVFDYYASPKFEEHQYGLYPQDVEGVKKAIDNLHHAFPDFSMVIEDLVVYDDKVWGRMTARGTQTGVFGPFQPTGKKIEITVIDIMRFEDGKLIEHWGVPDRFALMDQLGLRSGK